MLVSLYIESDIECRSGSKHVDINRVRENMLAGNRQKINSGYMEFFWVV